MTPDFFTIETGDIPILATAIHNGHELREEVGRIIKIDSGTRLREEDPYTGLLANITGNSVVVDRSRFELDLNRPKEKAVYLRPQDAWGLDIWKETPGPEIIAKTLRLYDMFYSEMRGMMRQLACKYGSFVVYDIHSYCYRRSGPGEKEDDPALNPEINIGTGSMDSEKWRKVVDAFARSLEGFEFMGRKLDVRENVRFKGGNFPAWVNKNFPGSGCAIAIEVKKIFMDEWTGELYEDVMSQLKDAFFATIDPVIGALKKI